MVGISSGVDDPGRVMVARPSWTRSGSKGEFHVRIVKGILELVFFTVIRKVGTSAGLTCETDNCRSLSDASDG